MNTLLQDLPTPRLPAAIPVRLTPAGPNLWRVLERGGRVIGHIAAVKDAAGIRFRARRYQPTTRAFRDLGEFWAAGDAVDCLRFAR